MITFFKTTFNTPILNKKKERKKKVSMYQPLTLLSSIMQPSFPKVTVTNLTLGNLKSIETSALGTVGASVHTCQQK